MTLKEKYNSIFNYLYENQTSYIPTVLFSHNLDLEKLNPHIVLDDLERRGFCKMKERVTMSGKHTSNDYIITPQGIEFIEEPKNREDPYGRLKEIDKQEKLLKRVKDWKEKFWWLILIIGFLVGLITPLLISFLKDQLSLK